jgi:hypothetical protein
MRLRLMTYRRDTKSKITWSYWYMFHSTYGTSTSHHRKTVRTTCARKYANRR